MKRRTALTLVACVVLGAAAVCAAQAERGPATPGNGAPATGVGRGGMFGRGPQMPPGPPAPVPPEVAMPRPTAEEVDKINAEIKQFIDTNKSANKDLLKKYASLMVVQVPRDNSAIRPTQTFVRTTERHNGFVDTTKKGDFDILFEGDSITDFWQNSGERGGGTDVQKKYFGDVKVANFAVGGDTTQGVL